MLSGERAQGLARTDLQQNSFLPLCQFLEAIGEANGLTQMGGPVIRVGRFLRGDPFARDVRHVRNLRWIQPGFSDLGREGVQHRRTLHYAASGPVLPQ